MTDIELKNEFPGTKLTIQRESLYKLCILAQSIQMLGIVEGDFSADTFNLGSLLAQDSSPTFTITGDGYPYGKTDS